MAYTDSDRAMLARIEKKIDSLLKLLTAHTKEGEKIMAKLDDLVAEVAEETSVIASAGTLLDGLTAQVRALRDDLADAGVDTAKVDAVLASLQANKAALQEAVVRNTPEANTAV